MDEERPLPCSEKVAFNTRREAQAAAAVAFYQHGTKLTVYICEHCGLWHLTS